MGLLILFGRIGVGLSFIRVDPPLLGAKSLFAMVSNPFDGTTEKDKVLHSL